MRAVLRFVYVVVIVAAIVAMTTSCNSSGTAYLKSLPLETEPLTAVDMICIDDYAVFSPNCIVKADDSWLLMSTTKGDYRLMFLNPSTSEHFFAIRKGRGPGEMIQGGSLHKSGDDAVFYDVNNAVCIRINLSETINKREPVIDTIATFTGGPSKPVYMTSCGESGFVSGNLVDPDVWYSYYDNTGQIISGVSALDFDGMPKDRDHRVSFLLSSKYAASPDGTRVCVANVVSPSLSFSYMDSGRLEEYRRYEMASPGMAGGRLTEDHVSAFMGIDADEKHVYVIYSGHKLKDDVLPTDECKDLVIYDWNGNPVRHYILDRSVNSISVEKDCIYATSTYPEYRVYKFPLPGFQGL